MKRAAVLVPIVDAREPRLLFVRRAAHLRRNPGQIAFPGGLVDPGDADASAAALREFEEELGLPRACARIVARLEDVLTPAVRALPGIEDLRVTPFVGILTEPAALRIDPAETERVHDVPLAAIYAAGAVHEGIERVAGYEIRSWLFDHDGMHVWGATGRMLHDLLVRFPAIGSLPLEAAASR